MSASAACPVETEAAIIGAGPAGMFQVFQLGLHGIRAHLIDVLPHVGGQCIELFPDKPIYDIPGLSGCTGRELTLRLQQQMAPFEPVAHLGQQVQVLQRQADGRWLLQTTRGTRLLARVVVITAGVGAFVPRMLRLEGEQALLGRSVHYHPPSLACLPLADQHIVVYGGEEQAVLAALALAQLAQPAASVTLMHRRDVFSARPELLDELRCRVNGGQLHTLAAQPQQLLRSPEGDLHGLQVMQADGQQRTLAVGQLLVYQGVSPKLGPLAEWGLALEKKQIPVNAATFETAQSGLYAVGDVNTYPGKRKLILCAFHEATLAAFAIAEQLAGASIALEYTTGSRRIHRLLGVQDACSQCPQQRVESAQVPGCAL